MDIPANQDRDRRSCGEPLGITVAAAVVLTLLLLWLLLLLLLPLGSLLRLLMLLLASLVRLLLRIVRSFADLPKPGFLFNRFMQLLFLDEIPDE